ncbi:MAG: hypothetical protein JKX78_12700 [Alteromonadaceae bacterium]|nr:hypothetical protein [Alteromonadaceae bacterium]
MTEPVFENTKYCKACIQEIPSEATKCPYCQTYQHWYKNPQNYGIMVVWPFLFIMFWNTGVFGNEKFPDYQDDFAVSIEKIVLIQNTKTRLITYKIKNNSDYKWRSINYLVISKKEDELITTITGIDYSWVVQPHAISLLTVKVPYVRGANSWQLKIKDLTVDR